jgi:hypothetical protein
MKENNQFPLAELVDVKEKNHMPSFLDGSCCGIPPPFRAARFTAFT